MLNITRFSPLEDAFENMFRGIPVWLPNPETRAPAPTPFRMDVTENDKEYRVLAELPGVKKEDIGVSINGHEVAVSAELKYEKDVRSGDAVLRAERCYGNRPGEVRRRRVGAHAAKESRSGREKARGALSGASRSRVANTQPRFGGVFC